MATAAIDSSRKESFYLAEFRYGDAVAPSFSRYTDWDSDFLFGSGNFISTPNMKVDVPGNDSLLADKTAQIILPTDNFVLSLSIGEPTSRVFVTITEILRAKKSFESITHFVGQVSRSRRNYEGRPGNVSLEAKPLKGMFKIALGIPCLAQCAWVFTKKGCGKDPVPLLKTGTCTFIQSKVVTVTGLPTQIGKYWHRGWIQRQGVRIGIKDWNGSQQTRFVLYKQPPLSWLNQSVEVFPGCDKLIGTCRDRWANEPNFLALGIATPPYNPLSESLT